MHTGRIAWLTILAATVAAATASAAIGPARPGVYGFVGTIGAPPVKPADVKVAGRACSSTGGLLQLDCEVKLDITQAGRAVAGAVAEPGRGLLGAFSSSCDFAGRITASVQVSSAAVAVTDVKGSFGKQTCTWEAGFGGGSRLTGTLTATDLALRFFGGASPALDLSASVRADVLGGGGIFSGLRGGGTLVERLRVPLPVSTLDSALDRAFAQVLGGLAGAVTTLPLTLTPAAAPPPAQSELGLRLTTGNPTVKIVSPPDDRIKRSDVLRLATGPGASCSATAKQLRGPSPGRLVSLGAASDTFRKGVVRFPGSLRDRLTPLEWRVEVTCAQRVETRDSRGRLVSSRVVKSSVSRVFRTVD